MNNLNDSSTTLTIPVDSEHSGIRIVVVLVFLATWLLTYLMLDAVIPSAGMNFIAIGGSLVLAFLATWLVERLLKGRWPSGRVVQVERSGVRMARKGTTQAEIRAEQPVSVLLWRFQTKRRTRVPKGWYVLACALEQNERYLSVYTFLSPTQFKGLEKAERFTLLKGKKDVTKDPKGGRDDLLLAGEQRRLMQAENQRWLEGAEMTAEDFQTYLAHLSGHFPEWMP
jgi:hypothetical protein